MNTEKYSSRRKLFRVLGPILLMIAAYLVITSIGEFFSLSHFEQPKKFHYFFIAMPFFLVGAALTNFGYMRSVADYTAREMAPVAKDTVNYLLKETKPGVESLSSALRGESSKITCPKCQEQNDDDSKFCNSCGTKLALVCTSCNEVNKPDAKFCDQCGNRL